ncbi:hypothetical protein BDP27DRAFT_1438895 [Rhodocollybia butyracea]|uniref:Uncharacterized protein n=1 Tax=Rhodocollybia butyracea TaxID=206335 RepID=A0A9P5TVS0_9AGAR|nr:hypothetical protein BDP27DRAFT_1438895 [Rhodocollybia butyracea]
MHFILAFVATLATLAVAIPAPHIRPLLAPAPLSLPLPGSISAPPGLSLPNLFLRGRRDLEQVVQPVLQAAQPVFDSSLLTVAGPDVAGLAEDTANTTTLQVEALPMRTDQILAALDSNPGILGDLDKVLLGRGSGTAPPVLPRQVAPAVSYTCTSGVSLMCCDMYSAGNMGEACTLPISGETCVAPSQALCCAGDPPFNFQCVAATPLTHDE